MKILILGSDGYLGRALTPYLQERSHEVEGIDCRLRDLNVKSVGSNSLVPISGYSEFLSVCNYRNLKTKMAVFNPDAIVHFAEQPSAPFSLRSQQDAVDTQENNIIGTMNVLWAMREVCPEAHLVKLGTMGVYGTPEGDILESDGPITYDPGSFYHISKACDSMNIRKACQWWGLNATDLHQGIVYGHVPGTRFDYDSYFGTVINRFLVQGLIGHPLTIYGKGGQTRGFINIKDTLRCIEIAIENPPKGYRVFNQFTDIFSVKEIANKISHICGVKISSIENPRFEKEDHFYSADHRRLPDLGLISHDFDEELFLAWEDIQPYRKNVIESVVLPQTNWKVQTPVIA